MAHHCRHSARDENFIIAQERLKQPHLLTISRLYSGKNMLLHYDGGDPSKSIDLTELVASEANAQIYCCGPRGLMTALAEVVDLQGGSLITEDFNPVGANADEAASKDGDFTVELLRSGLTVDVGEGQTIIQALKAVNVDVETSCEAGVCGTCVVDYLEGEPVHNDVVLMPDEQEKSVALCVAGCKSEKIGFGFVAGGLWPRNW